MKFTAKELAEVLHGTVDGNPDAVASSFAKIEHGRPGNLCFFANPKYEQYVYTSKASILLVNKDFEPKSPVTPTMIRVDNAYSAITELLSYASASRRKYRRHRGCWIHIALSAKLGRRVWIGDCTHIGRDTRIGDCTRIMENVSIGRNVRIGHHCILYPGVCIYDNTIIGDNVIVHANAVIGSDGFGNAPQPDGSWKKIEHLGNVIIGNNVEIGACTTIDRAEMESTIIEDGVKIDNLCQIAHNVRIGRNTAMAAMCGIAGSAVIGESCLLGGQVGVVGHIKIADHTTVGAQAGVIGNIRKSGEILMGMPAIPHKTYMRSYALFKRAGEEN